MIKIDEIASDKTAKEASLLEAYYPADEMIMFDIETTGLSADRSFIYLIGVNYKKHGKWYITQLFNDDGKSEGAIITAFMQMIEGYKYLLHFNGDRFDIPFVTTRLEFLNKKFRLGIPNFFPSLTSVDLMKIIRPYKTALGLPNIKQKTIEDYLSLHRIDTYNGGELIPIYLDYVVSQSEHNKKLVLQHNRDDMEGMYYLSALLPIAAFGSGHISIKNLKIIPGCETPFSESTAKDYFYLSIAGELEHALPKKIELKKYLSVEGSDKYRNIPAFVSGEENRVAILIPIIQDCFYHFFDTYKDYYYYPALDEAFHKDSMPTMDTHREKAKCSNCYTKHTGFFVPCFSFCEVDLFHADSSNRKKNGFIELQDNFLGNEDYIATYVSLVLQYFMR